jgi:hypothetical protein
MGILRSLAAFTGGFFLDQKSCRHDYAIATSRTRVSMAAWDTKDIIVVVGMALTVLTNGGLAFLNHRLGRAKYQHEKLWELRREAYSQILFDLAEAELHMGYAVMGGPKEGIGNEDTNAWKGWNSFQNAIAGIRKNYIICSAPFRSRFDAVQHKVYEGTDFIAPFAVLRSIFNSGHTELFEIARRELGL